MNHELDLSQNGYGCAGRTPRALEEGATPTRTTPEQDRGPTASSWGTTQTRQRQLPLRAPPYCHPAQVHVLLEVAGFFFPYLSLLHRPCVPGPLDLTTGVQGLVHGPHQLPISPPAGPSSVFAAGGPMGISARPPVRSSSMESSVLR